MRASNVCFTYVHQPLGVPMAVCPIYLIIAYAIKENVLLSSGRV
jgi:hypothetical protein